MGLKDSISLSTKNIATASVSAAVSSLGVDQSVFVDPYSIPISYGNLFNRLDRTFVEDGFERFTGLLRAWKSMTKEDVLDYWILDSCVPPASLLLGEYSNSENSLMTQSSAVSPVEYLPVLMEDYYKNVDYVDCSLFPNSVYLFRSNTSTLQYMAEHISLIHMFNNINVFYIRMKYPVEDVDTKDFAIRRFLSYPYTASPTTHEFFRLMLEWQWCKYELDCQEPIAIEADKFLTTLGLNVNDPDNLVVSSLMDLPDQQVFQYLKNGNIEHIESDVSRPEEFTKWFVSLSELFSEIKKLHLI